MIPKCGILGCRVHARTLQTEEALNPADEGRLRPAVGKRGDETMDDSKTVNPENFEGAIFLEELKKIALNMQANGTGRDSFEMRQTARGARVYDIKMYRLPDETTAQYMARFDELDNQLGARARLGE